MSFLDKPVGELSMTELTRLIRKTVGLEVGQAMPQGVADLSNLDVPVVVPDGANQADVLTWDPAQGKFVARPLNALDGDAPVPVGAPSVQGGIGFLAVSWGAVTNNDNVTYEVHVSDTTGFTPDSTTLAGELQGTMLFVRRLPDGTDDGQPLEYDTDYFVVIISKDGDGSASPSAETSAQIVQVDSPDIAANAIIAGKILAGEITADKFAATLILSSVIKTAADGQRVEISTGGIQLIDSSEATVVNIPTDSGQPVSVTGSIVATALTATGAMLIEDTASMSTGATFTLAKGQGDPVTAPTLIHNWDVMFLDDPGNQEYTRGLFYDPAGDAGGATPTFLALTYHGLATEWKISEYDASTGDLLRQSATIVSPAATIIGMGYGICRLGTKIYILVHDSAATGPLGWLMQFNQSDLTDTGVNLSFPKGAGTQPSNTRAIGTDGTYICMLSRFNTAGSDYAIRMTRYSPPAPTWAASVDTQTSDIEGESLVPLGMVKVGSDIWYSWYSVTGVAPFFEVYYTKTTGTNHDEDPDNRSRTDDANAGLAHDGTRFFTPRTGATPSLISYSLWDWAAPGAGEDNYWVGYTWYNTAGSYESLLSPVSALNMQDYRRSRIKVTVPSFPAGVTAVRVYMVPDTDRPAPADTFYQDTSYVTSQVDPVMYVFNYDDSAAAPPTSSSFPGSTPSEIRAVIDTAVVTAPWKLKGDSAFLLTRATTDERDGSPSIFEVAGSIIHNEDEAELNYHDGSDWHRASVPQFIPVGDNLPFSPRDGKEVFYEVQDQGGVVWHLRYDGQPAAECTITIASPGVITQADHGFREDEAVTLDSSGALPTGLTIGAIYFVRGGYDSDNFTVAATPGGAAINTSGSQSGTHTAHTPYRWNYVGGAYACTEVITDETYASASGFVDPATPGPTMDVHLEGDYEFIADCELYRSGSATTDQWAIGLIGLRGGVSTSAQESRKIRYLGGASGGVTCSTSSVFRVTAVADSETATLRYYCATGTPHVRYRKLRMRPIRVKA